MTTTENPAREAQRQAFDKWIKEVAGVPSEYNRMYGHHLTTFMAGCDWAGDTHVALQKRVEELEGVILCLFDEKVSVEDSKQIAIKAMKSITVNKQP